MATQYERSEGETRKRRPFLRMLILLLLTFLAGAAAMGYLLTHWSVAGRFIAGEQPAPIPIAPIMLPMRGQAVVADPAMQVTIERRVSELEQRIGQIGARASAAAGNADRAEGLLVAFAARRALDRGTELGYIEALLRDRFGEDQPQAVATIIAAARQPVTLEELEAGLTDATPLLLGGSLEESWWEGLRREVSELVIVRRSNAPSPEPVERLARARRQLEAGHVGAALAEVSRLPGRDRAQAWISQARRYAAARDALDVIETAALLEPQRAQPVSVAPAPVAIPPAAAAPVVQPTPTTPTVQVAR